MTQHPTQHPTRAAAPDAHLDAEVEAVCAAVAILNSRAPHTVGTIHRACITAKRFGDGSHHILADQTLAGLEARAQARREADATPVQRPPYSPQVTRIRDVLAGALITVSVCYVALLAVLIP